MPSLPSIVSVLPPDLRIFLDRVREAIGNSSGKLLTTSELASAGLGSLDSGGNLIPVNNVVVVPPAPTNVGAAGALTTIIITWDAPAYVGHAYAEIWRAPTNNIGEALLIGQSPGSVFSDAVGNSFTG